jgi:hypothetical protein
MRSEKHGIAAMAGDHSDRTLKERDSNDSADEKLPPTQPPAHHDEETTRNCLFLPVGGFIV